MPETLVVACKLPHGLILRLYETKEVHEAQRDGTTKLIKRSEPLPGEVQLDGYLKKYKIDLPPAAQGSKYEITTGVSKEFFEEWLRQNKDHQALTSNLILWARNTGELKAKMRAFEGTRSGLEPIDRNTLPKGIANFKKDAA